MKQNITPPEEFFVVDRRGTSWIIAGALTLLLCAFLAGYVCGKKSQLRDFQLRNDDDVFVDRARYAVLAPANAPAAQDDIAPVPVLQTTEDERAEPVPTQAYVAQLVGFSQLKRAQAFVERLKNSGIITRIVTRKSVNGAKKMVWYQVVTEPFVDRQELEFLVQRLKQSERLKNVKIITVDRE